MTKAPPFPFESDEIVLSRDGFYTVIDGADVIVALGERHRSSEPVVKLRPELFCRDGEPLMPIERPEIPEPEPPAPKPQRKMLRAKIHFSSGDRELQERVGPGFSATSKFHFEFVPGQEVHADWPPLASLTKREMRDLFEEVPEEP
jgi:hypothetical protein